MLFGTSSTLHCILISYPLSSLVLFFFFHFLRIYMGFLILYSAVQKILRAIQIEYTAVTRGNMIVAQMEGLTRQ